MSHWFSSVQKKYLTSGEVDPYTQGVSLPIGDRQSAKVGTQNCCQYQTELAFHYIELALWKLKLQYNVIYCAISKNIWLDTTVRI